MSGTTRALRWRALATPTDDGAACDLEHVELKIAETGITAEAVMIAGRGADAHGLRWRLVIDADWASFRSLHLTRLGGATVALRHDGYGEWSDGEGKKRKEFAGLTDCLIDGSPFGPTALLARLGAKAAKTQTLDVVTVALPSLAVARTTLTLTPLAPGRRWRLAWAGRVEEIEVDDDRFVTRWGDRWARVDLAAPEPAVAEPVAL